MAKGGNGGWKCSFCTYQNGDSGDAACAMCSKPRPADTKLPAQKGDRRGSITLNITKHTAESALLQRLVDSGKLPAVSAQSWIDRQQQRQQEAEAQPAEEWHTQPSVRDLQMEEMRRYQEELLQEFSAGRSS